MLVVAVTASSGTYQRSAQCQAPRAADGRLHLSIRNFEGLMEIDAVSVQPVSDRRNDSLTSFLEGTETP